MVRKLFFALLFACVAITSSAQSRGHHANAKNSMYMVTRAYEDSLAAYKRLLAEAQAGNDSLREQLSLNRRRPQSYALLTPLTYDGAAVARMFSVNGGDSASAEYDKAMTAMFVKRPDLVFDSQRKIEKSGGIEYVPERHVRQDVNFTVQAKEETEEKTDDVTFIAPVDLVQIKPNFWTFIGDYSLQFLQNYVSENWYKGGESSYAMIGGVVLQFNYNDKDKIKFDNKLEMKLGMQSAQGDTIHEFKSSEDLIRLTSKLGVQASKRWYYTLQLLSETQFTHGYKSNDNKVYSDFCSPLKLNFSLGMDYKMEWLKKKLTGTVNISPLAANFKYFNRLNLAEAAGYDEGKHGRWDFGSTFTADLAWKFSELVKWQTRLYAYTTYHRTEVEWENTLTFQLSKYISTKIFIYPRFDDSVKSRNEKFGYFQVKEYWSLGFNYSL